MKHHFWKARVKSIENFIFGILTSRAVDRYIYMGRIGEGLGGPPTGF
jgi:hypothetical protein